MTKLHCFIKSIIKTKGTIITIGVQVAGKKFPILFIWPHFSTSERDRLQQRLNRSMSLRAIAMALVRTIKSGALQRLLQARL